MVEIATSVLDVPEENAIQTLYNIEVAKTDYFHIDVMDGIFVEKNTTQKMTTYCEYLNNITNVPLDVHLMVEDIPSYIESFSLFEPSMITIHYEACKNIEQAKQYIQRITSQHCKVGISIKPDTKVEDIQELLPYVHVVLVMSVEPGKGGQAFMLEALEKIQQLAQVRKQQDLDFAIEVDGGINDTNIAQVVKAGAEMVVVGNYLIKSENIAQAMQTLKDLSI